MDILSRSSGVSAIAEYEYTAKEADELNLIKGAIIHNVKMKPGGWWEGTLGGKSGVFPDNFVKILESDDKSPVILRDKTVSSHRRCKAVYSYTQNNEDELTLGVDDIIEFLGEVEEGWWRGRLGSKTGVFPSNFVVAIENTSPVLINRKNGSTNLLNRRSLSSSREDLVSSSPQQTELHKDAPSLPPKPVRELCKVLFPYDPANEDELELVEGEIVSILSKELPDKGWWKGEIKGKIGVFPDNFVSLLSSEPSPTKENTNKPERPPPSSKMLITKSPNNILNNSNRKDNFGSKDSVNDSPGIVVGHVAAHRLSLEHRNIDPPSGIDKPSRKGFETKSTSDLRKSIENLDDNRKSTPPPVLTKKPLVPIKKSPTLTSVTGNLFSGLKSKVKSVEQKLTAHDSLDGIGNSRMSVQITESSDKTVTIERIKSVGETDFDQVERSSILPDMRAGRVKPPKRRPPSAATNSVGENNNNNITNGGSSIDLSTQSDDTHLSSDDAKPKPRNWEKQKVPWMAELKASQAKKTPLDAKSPESIKTKEIDNSTEFESKMNDMSKSFSSSYVSSHRKSSEQSTFEVRANSIDVKSNQNNFEIPKKEIEPQPMTKSMSSLATKISIQSENATNLSTSTDDPIPKIRPVSVSLRNRSISPVGKPLPTTKSINISPEITKIINNETFISVTTDNVCTHVAELEFRVNKLEKMVQSQNTTIELLIKSLKDETDKVKILKTELDKYAQCVTQV